MSGGIVSAADLPSQEQKLLNLAVLKKGTRDFLSFVDATEDMLFGYLYHRTGSLEAAHTLTRQVYFFILSRALSFWWFGRLTHALVLQVADQQLEGYQHDSDIDAVYVPGTYWLSSTAKKDVASLHEALWSLDTSSQRLLVLSLLLGYDAKKIATIEQSDPAHIETELSTARSALEKRWSPTQELASRMRSLVFIPGMSIPKEIELRQKLIEKYNALRLRQYQWVAIGGFLALFSNFIVAGFIAFAASVQPTTRGVAVQVASLEALQHEPAYETYVAHNAVQSLRSSSEKLVAYDVARRLNSLALSAARLAAQDEQKQEKAVDQALSALAFAVRVVRLLVASLVQ